MHKNKHLKFTLAMFIAVIHATLAQPSLRSLEYEKVTVGAQRFSEYVPQLKKKRVAIVTNGTGLVNGVSIVDTLLHQGVKVVKIFGPEHGFRGNTEAGEYVKNNRDITTGLPVISLYGKNKKPSKEQLKHIDVVIYDIQDLGVRFYTYISTLTYVMQACAENNIRLIVLDRPNPNGFYLDGPVLQKKYRSFLGLHPVPIVYGMTCGEYASMVNEEGWLNSDTAAFYPRAANTLTCDLTVIKMLNYDRNSSYHLQTRPSPNIPNHYAVQLYPSLGLFEGTVVGLGRGTSLPFQVIGHPYFKDTSYVFIPVATPMSSQPKYLNKRCYGIDLRRSDYIDRHPRTIELRWLVRMYKEYDKDNFFENGFNYHAGNDELQEQIKNNVSLEIIRKSWQPDIDKFKVIRNKYLLYGDFQDHW